MAGQLSSQKLAVWFSLVWLLMSSTGFPQESQKKGDASLRLEYQYIRTGAFDSSVGEIDIGNTDSHVALLSGDYALNERWKVTASLPYIQKRHKGALPHNPVLDFSNYTPPDLTIVDDGEFHGGLQDFSFGVQYLTLDGPLSVTPFIAYGLPTNDYPFYAHAAIGRNIWHLPVGVSLGYTPYFSDWYFSGHITYVFTEKTLGVDISHWLVHASASYYFTPRFAPNIFVSIKHGFKGLDFPDDFPPEVFDSEFWYVHDRTVKHNFINAGIGFDWILSDKYQLSGTIFTMVDPQQVNIVEFAGTFGLTRFFSGND